MDAKTFAGGKSIMQVLGGRKVAQAEAPPPRGKLALLGLAVVLVLATALPTQAAMLYAWHSPVGSWAYVSPGPVEGRLAVAVGDLSFADAQWSDDQKMSHARFLDPVTYDGVTYVGIGAQLPHVSNYVRFAPEALSTPGYYEPVSGFAKGSLFVVDIGNKTGMAYLWNSPVGSWAHVSPGPVEGRLAVAVGDLSFADAQWSDDQKMSHARFLDPVTYDGVTYVGIGAQLPHVSNYVRFAPEALSTPGYYEPVSGFAKGSLFVVDIPSVSAVPEPGTWAMMILGFAVTGAALRRRSRPNAPGKAATVSANTSPRQEW